ncbi:MAG TPA: serine hydrolase domain-containing protein [Syntrophales bacterium]|nr:serine hydrolase domain-containing protein [Syntrophales bacterium]HOL59493.1 serine hydrolase domain-containing protein [Syntrophales bacterium]HPO34675.1 serine hydrolase domain-containing protein [Syntrophales bacterium]
MKKIRWVCGAFFVLSMIFISPNAYSQMNLNSMLMPYLSEYELPAIAACFVKDGKIVASGVAGVRKTGTNIPVTINDKFHIGSDTKAFTALLAAMLVEEGKLSWHTTIGEVFLELSEDMDKGVRQVTLEQLLSHTSGIPTDNEEIFNVYREAMLQEGNLDEMRYGLVKKWVKKPLTFQPGSQFAYSNMGYTIAGAMIERRAKKTWDELIVECFFTPLKLKTAGLGPQASLGKIDAPLGHMIINGKTKAFLSGPNGDVPPLLGPAGIAHMSILDFARWASWNAGKGRRAPYLVKPGTLKKLHTPVIDVSPIKDTPPGTPPRGKYCLGWGETTPDWAQKPILSHAGSNGMNLAHIWIDTEEDYAMVLTTNIGGKKADDALRAVAKELYERYEKKSKR